MKRETVNPSRLVGGTVGRMTVALRKMLSRGTITEEASRRISPVLERIYAVAGPARVDRTHSNRNLIFAIIHTS